MKHGYYETESFTLTSLYKWHMISRKYTWDCHSY